MEKIFRLFGIMVFFSLVTWSELYAARSTVLENARGSVEVCLRKKSDLITPVTTDGKFNVGIGIVPLSITNVDPQTHSAEIDFYLTVEYEIDASMPNVKCVGKNASQVWEMFYNPDIEFTFISNPEYMQGEHWMVEDNRFAFMTRVRGDIQLIGDFRNFPFDNITINIGVAGEDSSKYLLFHPSDWYHADLNNLLPEFSDIQIPGWHLSKAYFSFNEDVVREAEEYWQEIQLTLEVRRMPLTYVFRLQLPLLCLYMIALFSLILRNENSKTGNFDDLIEARMAVQVGCVLALFAYSLYFMTIIPETGYLTLGDLNWSVFMVAMLLVILSEYARIELSTRNYSLSLKTLLISSSLLIVLLLIIYQAAVLIKWWGIL